ncbi:MAG: exopolyphosphatase [Symbiobacteriaceae bacterium]|nr:exopolyphosphatase [Symbiobacteriaceae bacterium]
MRLVTRSDFDGLICGFLLRELGLIDSWVFVHPKDLQDGKFTANTDDVLVNVPYVEGCGLWFDHHSSEIERVWTEYDGSARSAPSCARIIFDYYGGVDRFPGRTEMVDYADRIDSGNLTYPEIIDPQGWVLLGFLTDPRSGLGRFHDYKISNYQLMSKLLQDHFLDDCDTILDLNDVKERVARYYSEDRRFRQMLQDRTRIEGNVIITDLRGIENISAGNRFIIYSMFPDQNVSLWIAETREMRRIMISCGHSILNRSCKTDVGSLMLRYYGGGHQQVGTCQISADEVDTTVAEIIRHLQADEAYEPSDEDGI